MIIAKLKCPICGRTVKTKSTKDEPIGYVCECGYDSRKNSVKECTLKSLRMEN